MSLLGSCVEHAIKRVLIFYGYAQASWDNVIFLGTLIVTPNSNNTAVTSIHRSLGTW